MSLPPPPSLPHPHAWHKFDSGSYGLLGAIRLPALVLACCGLVASASAATVTFDDFSTGAFEIGSEGGISNAVILSPVAEFRRVSGGGDPVWSSTVDVTAGLLSYVVAIPNGSISRSQRLSLTYSNVAGNIRLQGFDTLVLDVESLVGMGQVWAYVRNIPMSQLTPVSLTEAGELRIPFLQMGVEDSSSVDFITIILEPQEPTFSVTISGISVIPEPSVAGLAALGLLGLLAGRRR